MNLYDFKRGIASLLSVPQKKMQGNIQWNMLELIRDLPLILI